MTERWPELDYAAEQGVYRSIHAYLQVIGKLPTRASPWCNHSWHVAMRVVPRGFRTYPVMAGDRDAEVLFDCLGSRVEVSTSDGFRGEVPINGQSVAAFHASLSACLKESGIEVSIDGGPNEVPEAIPFNKDTADRPWDGQVARRLHRAFSDAGRVFEQFRTGFVGKSSPVHLFWGSFDLAVTRFSGREAPTHPGGFPNLPDDVTREAYSHEVASFGFWPGGGGVEEAAFYAYGYPVPEGLSETPVALEAVYWHDNLGEFVLPYAAVRAAESPEAMLLEFLESSYSAVAEKADWARAALDIPQGAFGKPYDVVAHQKKQ